VSAITRRTWSHLLAIAKPFFASELRWRALGMLALIVGLVLSLNGLIVVNSYVGRGFMTAIADREEAEYYTYALLYILVFAASTVVAVFYQFIQVPQNTHTVQGTLRDQLLYGLDGHAFTDKQIHEVLGRLKFEPVLERVGGLEAEHDWATTLSVGEQQLLAMARLLLARPRFAFLDRAVSALAPHRAKQVYQVLADTAISFISVGDHIREFHDQILELHEHGEWRLHLTQRMRSA
jgi:ABC-type uncharacterized transport system fused permease/ATPase subunit